jgi:SAM-dependent methyltransferase
VKLNSTLLKLILEEPVENYTLLDVGCGSGALSFRVAKKVKAVVGIDISTDALEEAKGLARENTSFFEMDADTGDYSTLGDFDLVVSHLCMSEDIIKNSYHVLPVNGVLTFACFDSRHLIEGGRRSRFSYSKDGMKKILESTGFTIEYLGVETTKLPFQNLDDAIAILGDKTINKWKNDKRLQKLNRYIENGGRHLTKSILVGKARKI